MDAGGVYLFRGPITGTLTPADAVAWFYGAEAGDEAADAGAVGDFNGDGIPDVVLGSDGADRARRRRSGAAYLFYGPVSGEYLVTDADLILQGEQKGDEMGYWVTGFGDGNGDGYSDLALTAPFDDRSGTDAGAVVICRGAGW